MDSKKNFTTYPNGLSAEVELLFMMTEVFMYEGLENINNIIGYSDEMHERKENDICVLIAKVFCYEQIIENIVDSLYRQNRIWKRVKLKDAKYTEQIGNMKYYKKLNNLHKLEDFKESKKLKKLCRKFKKIRNKFAHELMAHNLNDLLNNYGNLENVYNDIYDIYSEQNVGFANKISLELSNPEKILLQGKDYSEDANIIKKEAEKIIEKRDRTDAELENLANLHQIYILLKKYKNDASSSVELFSKEEMLSIGSYSFTSVEEWYF